jgi:hypothetical protein
MTYRKMSALIAQIRTSLSRLEIPPEDPRLAEFLEYCREGGRRIQYPDRRRVPLDLFNSRLRTLLLSEDPETRNLVYSPSGFHSPFDIHIGARREHDDPPYLRPPTDKNWHHWRITNWLFPPLTKLPKTDEHIDLRMTAIIKASRSGRISHFYNNGVQVPPELFDHPRAALLFDSDQAQRAQVKNRWGRGSRRPLISYVERDMLALFACPTPYEFTTIIRQTRQD